MVYREYVFNTDNYPTVSVSVGFAIFGVENNAIL